MSRSRRDDNHVTCLEMIDLRVRDAIGTPPGSVLQAYSLFAVWTLDRFHQVRTRQQGRLALNYVIHFADLLVLGDCSLANGSRCKLAAGDHSDADLAFSHINRANLLIHDVVLDGLGCVG